MAVEAAEWARRLPPPEREVVSLVFGLDGVGPMDLSTAAKHLGVAKSTAHKRYHGGISRLRSKFGVKDIHQ